MKAFACDLCGSPVFFENDRCLNCGARLGFFPDWMVVAALREVGSRPGNHVCAAGGPREYRVCENGIRHQVCNWMTPAGVGNPLCQACLMTEVIPDLSVPGNPERWHRLELAKRRCLYSLLLLGLPTAADPAAGKPGLRFRFLADLPQGGPVMTGHDWGVVTLNIAEADDDERERRRVSLHEPYRTLIGHFRHELGHYYWDRLIAGTPELTRVRELFGDETADYNSALQKYYAEGPAADWSTRTITSYASMHPWEDWAETWAHYLHLLDTVETAAATGLKPGLAADGEPTLPAPGPAEVPAMPFDELWQKWHPLTLALNSINRGMGLPDLYPFVVPPAALKKLRLVHEIIGRAREAGRKGPGNPPGTPPSRREVSAVAA